MNNESGPEALFVEGQRFRQVWVWVVMGGVVLLLWYRFFQQIVLGKPAGTNPALDTLMWIIWLVLGVAFPLLFYSMKLIMEVGSDRIRVRFYPLFFRTIYFEHIRSYEVCAYSPIRDLGGWGIRRWPGRGWAYTMQDSEGLQLELKNGKRLLIGSENPEKLV